jgi:hypothetical protein
MARSKPAFSAPRWLGCCACAILLPCFPADLIFMFVAPSWWLVPTLPVSAYVSLQALGRLAPPAAGSRGMLDVSVPGVVVSRHAL